MNPEERLKLIARTVTLIRKAIDNNGGMYHGMLVPNLQSITDLTNISDEHIINIIPELERLEKTMLTPAELLSQ